MENQGFFESLGSWLGSLIRFVVEALGGVFSSLSGAGGDFLTGLSHALGMEPSFLGLLALVVGLLMLVSSVRAFMRRNWVRGVLWLLIGLWLLSLLIS